MNRLNIRPAGAAAARPVLIGWAAAVNNVGQMPEDGHGVIVGTAGTVDGVTTGPVDPARAASFVRVAR